MLRKQKTECTLHYFSLGSGIILASALQGMKSMHCYGNISLGPLIQPLLIQTDKESNNL